MKEDIKKHPFSPDSLFQEKVFPDEIESNKGLVFFGASSDDAKYFASHGLAPPAPSVAPEGIAQLVDIFTRMHWGGCDCSGLAALMEASVHNGDTYVIAPTSFEARSIHALPQATRDFAGGRVLRAVRHALADLRRYQIDEAVRSKHERSLCAYPGTAMITNAILGRAGSTQAKVNLEWLADEIGKLRGLADQAQSAVDSHLGGIIFAVEGEAISGESTRCTSTFGRSGVQWSTWGAISSGAIVAQVEVPANYAASKFGWIDDELYFSWSCAFKPVPWVPEPS